MGINEERNKRMARYVLIPKHSGKVLDVDTSDATDGARVQQWDWLGRGNQKFRVEPAGGSNLLHYRLVAVHSGKRPTADRT
jgi:hypothetical protein